MTATEQSPERTVDSNIWNYHPAVAISIGGVFRNLSNPLHVLKGILFSWFGTYIRGIYLLLISALWLTIFPSMETIGAGGWGWILQIFVINIALMLTWAGGLHLHFYTFARQGKYLQFSMNQLETGAKFFLGDFFHQLHHRFFECNYGNSEVPLDKLSGHFHDGTRAATKKMRQRMKHNRKVRQ